METPAISPSGETSGSASRKYRKRAIEADTERVPKDRIVLRATEFSPALRRGAGLHHYKLVRPHQAYIDVPHLTHYHEVTQCLHCLFDRDVFVEAVDLEYVHVVGSKRLGLASTALEDGLSRERHG